MAKGGNKRQGRKPVSVVVAPSAFPDFSSFSNPSNSTKRREKAPDITQLRNGIELDFDRTVSEIHNLGRSQFTGKKKKKFEAEQYKTLTGRHKKREKIPVKIVRGIKKAQKKREVRMEKEARDSGVIQPSKKRKEKKSYSVSNRRDSRIHGPAPSAGFTSKGILHVKKTR